MRHERQQASEAVEAKGYSFHFQITNNGGRQACSVEVMASSSGDAAAFVRQNWPMIESRAREALAGRLDVGGAVRLALP
jgi:hypothetical protein